MSGTSLSADFFGQDYLSMLYFYHTYTLRQTMDYGYLKSLHIIFVVTWFAGLFYLVRLFIYHVEALEARASDPERFAILHPQFSLMERRLWYGITCPSALLTLIFGLSMLHNFFPLTDHPWLVVKLAFVMGLLLYHFSLGHLRKRLIQQKPMPSSFQLRLWNEVATVFLFAIVFLVVLKDTLKMATGLAWFLGLSLALAAGISWYKWRRTRQR